MNDYPVLGGVCNFDMIHPNLLAICTKSEPHVIRKLRCNGDKIHRYIWVDINHDVIPEGIIEVKFAGMPLMFIRRDIVEQIPLKGDTPYDPNPLIRARIAMSFDCAFCYECRNRKIPIRVDTRVKMLHLRGSNLTDITGWQAETMQVGKKEPKVWYQVGEQKQDLTQYYTKLIWEQNEYQSRDELQKYLKT